MEKGYKVFAGNSNRDLAQKICRTLNAPLGEATVACFPDGEINVKLEEDVRGADAFVIQSTCSPVNENIMELLIMVDSLRRASARRIAVVIPYFGYARKDRKDEGRVPITAKLVANMLTVAGVTRVVTMDLHASQIQGFFDIPVDHLYGSFILADYFKSKRLSDLVVASPDVGSSKRARAYAQMLGAGLAIIDKERLSDTKVAGRAIIGDVADKNVLITDDIIATGGSIAEGVRICKESGAKDVFVAATHAVFCGEYMEALSTADMKELVISDTIPLNGKAEGLPVTVLSTAPVFAEAIRRIYHFESLSSMFMERK